MNRPSTWASANMGPSNPTTTGEGLCTAITENQHRKAFNELTEIYFFLFLKVLTFRWTKKRALCPADKALALSLTQTQKEFEYLLLFVCFSCS